MSTVFTKILNGTLFKYLFSYVLLSGIVYLQKADFYGYAALPINFFWQWEKKTCILQLQEYVAD